jgi:hypothetical protein
MKVRIFHCQGTSGRGREHKMAYRLVWFNWKAMTSAYNTLFPTCNVCDCFTFALAVVSNTFTQRRNAGTSNRINEAAMWTVTTYNSLPPPSQPSSPFPDQPKRMTGSTPAFPPSFPWHTYTHTHKHAHTMCHPRVRLPSTITQYLDPSRYGQIFHQLVPGYKLLRTRWSGLHAQPGMEGEQWVAGVHDG